jgi:hypothetical protein
MAENLERLDNLEWLDLKGNLVSSVDDVSALASLPRLATLYLRGPSGEASNPACKHPAYSAVVVRTLPNLTILDGKGVLHCPTSPSLRFPSRCVGISANYDTLR